MAFDSPKFDFGVRDRDQVVGTKFTLRNTHSVPVTVGPILKGCSCSEATVTPNVIPAGSTATLEVAWRLHGKRGRSSEAVSVTYTGGGVAGSAYAQVFATVRGVIDADLDVLELSAAKRTGEITFTSHVGRAFKLTSVSTTHPSLTATVGADGRSVRVAFDPAVGGWESGRVFVVATTDQADEAELRVFVSLGR